MKKIWITGAEGHIGTALLDLLEGVEYQLLPTDIEEGISQRLMRLHSLYMSTVRML